MHNASGACQHEAEIIVNYLRRKVSGLKHPSNSLAMSWKAPERLLQRDYPSFFNLDSWHTESPTMLFSDVFLCFLQEWDTHCGQLCKSQGGTLAFLWHLYAIQNWHRDMGGNIDGSGSLNRIPDTMNPITQHKGVGRSPFSNIPSIPTVGPWLSMINATFWFSDAL